MPRFRPLLRALLAAVCATPLPATIDRNLDGVSDIWSSLHPSAGAATADPDGDGATNHAEALAGTDPTSAASRFTAATTTDASGNLVLLWVGAPGKSYQIESSANLLTWVPFSTARTGTASTITEEVRAAGATGASPQFWRVSVADHDTDGDGLNDWEEARLATGPTAADTDGDGIADGFEVAYGFNPKVAETGPREIPLWTDTAPVGGGATEPAANYNTLTLHLAAGGDGQALVVCPGGGYGGQVLGAEGHDIAAWLQSHNISGCVLRYRLPAGRPEVPLLDAQRALRFLRTHAAALGLDPRRIGIIGFSAGGHLAATASTLYGAGNPQAADPIDRVSSRPDFAVLVYPLVSMTDALTHGFSRDNLFGSWNATPALIQRFSAELNVTATTPPMYLAHAVDDVVVSIGNSRALAAALQARSIPHVLLELPEGGHGFMYQGVYYSGPSWDAWQAGSLAWLAALPLPGGEQ